MPIPTPKGDRTVNKKILLGMIACVLLLTVGLLTACEGGNSPADTTAEDTPAPTDATTEEPAPEATEPTENTTQPATIAAITPLPDERFFAFLPFVLALTYWCSFIVWDCACGL